MTEEGSVDKIKPTRAEYEVAKELLEVQIAVGMHNDLLSMSQETRDASIRKLVIDGAFGICLMRLQPVEHRRHYLTVVMDVLRGRPGDNLIKAHQLEHLETVLVKALDLPRELPPQL